MKKLITLVLAMSVCLSVGTANYTATSSVTVLAAGSSKTQIFGDFEYTPYSSYVEINDYLGTETIVEIPSEIDGKKVTGIADRGLSGNKTVEKFIIPEGVTTIGEYAFSTNDSLKEIVFPSTLTTIEARAFGYNKSLTEVQLPEGLQNMGECLFYTCYELTDIHIPSTVVSIEENMLASSCYKFENFHVDEDNPYYCDVDGVLYTKDMTRLVRYPLNKTDVKFEFPETVTEIAPSAFDTVRNLEIIHVPNHVTKIGERAFSMCANLKELKLPQGLTEIPMYSIGSLYQLEKLYIPKSVTNIGKIACTFYDIMPTIYYEGTQADWEQIIIESGNTDFSELEFVYGYTYDMSVKGDCNADGKFNIADVVALQKWLLAVPDATLADWKVADLCEDDRLDVFDLCLMKRELIVQSAENTPENMPVIMDVYGEVTNADRENLWGMLSAQYPDMDFSDFRFVYDPDHPIGNYQSGKIFSIYYKNILLHGFGNLNTDCNAFAAIGKRDAVNFVVDPKLFAQVDLEQEVIPPWEVLPTSIETEKPELILYVDDWDERSPRLAYRAVGTSGEEEWIFDAITGEKIEWIPYFVV